VTKGGNSAVVSTEGNNDCHIILRGGKSPNYNPESIASACSALREASLPERLMIDASHANCDRKSQNQIKVCSDIASQIGDGNTKIIGVMIESNLVAGRQDLNNGKALKYGQSITDSCVGWEETTEIIENLAAANRTRRTVTQS
jgi:3-deoxy-7-phosphoheptulonate synthase